MLKMWLVAADWMVGGGWVPVVICDIAKYNNRVLQSNRLVKIENLESLINLEQLYLSDNGIETIEGLDTLVCNSTV